MSFQNYTKTLEELQYISRVICNNFSELVGCEDDIKTWSPVTAYSVCEQLSLVGSACSNVSDQYETDGIILAYKFKSSINQTMKDIWTKVLNYDTSVYNLKKLTGVKLNLNLSIENRLKTTIKQSKDYDCSIIEALSFNTEIVYTEDYRRLMWILLACYSIRYAIYDFAHGKSDLIDLEVLSGSFLNRVIENLYYEKHALIKFSKENESFSSSSDFISKELSTLLKNCKQLKMYVIRYLE